MVRKLSRILYVVMAVLLFGVAVVEVKRVGITARAALAGLGGMALAISAAAGKG